MSLSSHLPLSPQGSVKWPAVASWAYGKPAGRRPPAESGSWAELPPTNCAKAVREPLGLIWAKQTRAAGGMEHIINTHMKAEGMPACN